MMDLSSSLAPIMYEALKIERDRVFEARRWKRRLRELRARDRRESARCITVNKPDHLAGVHKL